MKIENIKKPFLLITYAILLYFIIHNFLDVLGVIKYVLKLFSPFFIGIGIAFVLNLLMRFYERKILNKLFEHKKIKKYVKIKRPVSMIMTYLSAVIIITLIINFIIPQIGKSVSSLTANYPEYQRTLSQFLNNFIGKYDVASEMWDKLINNIDKVLSNASQFLNIAIPSIMNITKGLTSGVINIFLGIVFSVYMLFSKEKLLKILKKIIYAVFTKETAQKILAVSADANKILRSFIGGQLTESVILGVLCFIGMSIFKMPYAPLVSVLIGITSLVPVLGPYVGVVISAVLILFESPLTALWFVIFVVILQQLEGNLIYPRVVGNAVGLNGMWVLLAVVLGGSLFGVLGILLGVPVMAVIYSLVSHAVNKRLKEKECEI